MILFAITYNSSWMNKSYNVPMAYVNTLCVWEVSYSKLYTYKLYCSFDFHMLIVTYHFPDSLSHGVNVGTDLPILAAVPNIRPPNKKHQSQPHDSVAYVGKWLHSKDTEQPRQYITYHHDRKQHSWGPCCSKNILAVIVLLKVAVQFIQFRVQFFPVRATEFRSSHLTCGLEAQQRILFDSHVFTFQHVWHQVRFLPSTHLQTKTQTEGTVKPVLWDHCHERPPVLKDHLLLVEGPTFWCNWTCHQWPPVLRDHTCIFTANRVPVIFNTGSNVML